MGRETYFCYLKEKACRYFLKTKTINSCKVIYFKRNKIQNLALHMLVENMKFNVTKITYIQVTTILYPKEKKESIKKYID